MAVTNTHPDEQIQNKVSVPDTTQDPWLHRDLASEFGVRRGDEDLPPLIDVPRLRAAIDYSAKQMEPFLENYREAIRYYAGGRYGEGVDLDKTPMNMLKLTVDVWTRELISQTPRCLVLTRSVELRPQAYELELAIDHLLQEIKFGETMAEVVRSGIFGMGIVKVGITDPYLAEGSNFTADSGQPYAEAILLDDFLFDFNARKPEECDWMAHRYRIPLEQVLENPYYDPEVKAKLQKSAARTAEELPIETSERTDQMSRSSSSFEDSDYRDYVELYDIWFPFENLLVTLPVQKGLAPLQIRPWEGPESGPFHLLALNKIPGNFLPSPPAQHLIDLQDLLTRLFNQLGRQAERQQTVLAADGQAVQDGSAQRIMDASDGAVVPVGHIEGLKEISLGGVSPDNFRFVSWLREMSSYFGGNVDTLGGLATQAGTLGQEQLLAQSSSALIRDLQSHVISFMTSVMKDLAWYLYTDPLIQLPLTKRVEDYGEIPFVYGPERREADFFEYNLSLQPYSFQSQGPTERLQRILQVATQILLPLAPQMQQWDLNFNLKKLVEYISKYGDMPEIADLISSRVPLEGQETINVGGGGGRTLQSPSTQRTYTRQNVPTGGTLASRENQLRQALNSAGQGENLSP